MICRFTRRVTAACGDTSERMGEACIYGYDHRSPGNNYSTYNTITIEEKSTLPLTHHFLPPAKTHPSILPPQTSHFSHRVFPSPHSLHHQARVHLIPPRLSENSTPQRDRGHTRTSKREKRNKFPSPSRMNPIQLWK